MAEAAGSVIADRVRALVDALLDELVAIRRDSHAHPELGRTEARTTAVLADRLRAAGCEPRLLPGTGLVCDIGPSTVEAGRRRVALRADIDALAVPDTCGHDVHAATVLGAGLVLAQLAGEGMLAAGVRLVFQAAEELQPGGAIDAIEAAPSPS